MSRFISLKFTVFIQYNMYSHCYSFFTSRAFVFSFLLHILLPPGCFCILSISVSRVLCSDLRVFVRLYGSKYDDTSVINSFGNLVLVPGLVSIVTLDNSFIVFLHFHLLLLCYKVLFLISCLLLMCFQTYNL